MIRSDIDFPKRAKSITSQMSVATYTADLFELSEVNPCNVAPRSPVPPIPPWELQKPVFDIDHTQVKKKESPNLLAVSVKSHLESKYKNYLKVFTDGSVIENKQAGAAFVIPALRIEKSYFLGKYFSIFTAELCAILMALRYLADFPRVLFQIVFCVDSKSVLNSLKSSENKVRAELILEIKHTVNSLILRGTDVSFCWVPSHCGISTNDWVDRAAKKGAQNDGFSEKVTLPFSIQEGYSLLEKGSYTKLHRSSNNRYCQANKSSVKICSIESNLNIVSTPCFYSRSAST